MTSCQIAFAYNDNVICVEEFTANTPDVLQKMKIAVWTYLPMGNIDRQEIVLETMCAGYVVSIKADQDAAKYIFGCAVDGKAKIRVKTSWKVDAKEMSPKLESAETPGMLDMPAYLPVDLEFMRELSDLLDSWTDKEIPDEGTYALVEALKKLLHSLGKDGFKEFELLNELKQDAQQLQNPPEYHEHLSDVSIEQGEAGTESENEQKQLGEKDLKRQARIDKRMEKFGCKTIEELNALESVKKDAQVARALGKYGCASEEELKQVRLEKRLAKKLERYGCQNEEELKHAKLSEKLKKQGLKRRTKLSKSNPAGETW